MCKEWVRSAKRRLEKFKRELCLLKRCRDGRVPWRMEEGASPVLGNQKGNSGGSPRWSHTCFLEFDEHRNDGKDCELEQRSRREQLRQGRMCKLSTGSVNWRRKRQLQNQVEEDCPKIIIHLLCQWPLESSGEGVPRKSTSIPTKPFGPVITIVPGLFSLCLLLVDSLLERLEEEVSGQEKSLSVRICQ